MNTRSVQRALNSIMGHGGAPSSEAMSNGMQGEFVGQEVGVVCKMLVRVQ